jgi:hypothetical protein
VQYLEKAAMIRQTRQRIAGCLMWELILKRALLRDINSNDFMSGKVSLFVIHPAAAEPGFQRPSVLPLPLDLDGFDSVCLRERFMPCNRKPAGNGSLFAFKQL